MSSTLANTWSRFLPDAMNYLLAMILWLRHVSIYVCRKLVIECADYFSLNKDSVVNLSLSTMHSLQHITHPTPPPLEHI